jgi:putative ATP-dependent endonuclease of OLD family
MKIETIRIQNFRGFRDETIPLDDYTAFVGANGAGKSTVLAALNVFFRQYRDSKTDLSRLSVEDFHHRDVSQSIRITVTFKDLSEQAKADLSDYVRSSRLIVSSVASYDPRTQRADVEQYGSRLGMVDFRQYFEADKNGDGVADLQKIFESFRLKYSELSPAKTKQAMSQSLRAFEASHPQDLQPIESKDQFYGATKGANRLAPHIQWIFVPASKDIAEEAEEKKSSALGQLLARTIRTRVDFAENLKELRRAAGEGYQAMLDSQQSVLNELSISIEIRLQSWAHPNATAKVLWRQDPDKSVKLEEPWAFIQIGERGFESELSRFGHGMQRSCMLTILQELSANEASGSVPTLVMGIEEPELYQHPPQARHLSDVLQSLSEKDSQILLCSHSPLFIPGDRFDSVRLVRERGTPVESFVSHISYDQLANHLATCGEKAVKADGMLAKLYPILNPSLNEMFFCKVLVLMEGIEDVAYLSTCLALENRLMDFRKYGCHVVPVGGKSELIRPIAIAQLLKIPVFAVFDADTNAENEEHKRRHKQDNGRLFKLLGYQSEGDWPSADVWKKDCVIWTHQFSRVVQDEIGKDWQAHFETACGCFNSPGGLHKNPLVIAKALELASAAGLRSTSLTRLVSSVLDFASRMSLK